MNTIVFPEKRGVDFPETKQIEIFFGEYITNVLL